MSLCWKVYKEDFNTKKIVEFNIFDLLQFKEDCVNFAKEKNITKEQFKKDVKNSLMYCYWGKCEYEIILSDWPPSKTFKKEKVSIYDQVMLNFDNFIDCIWRELKGECNE